MNSKLISDNTKRLQMMSFKQYKLQSIYKKISFLEAEYPKFKEWFFFKVVPDVLVGKRSIVSNYNSRGDLESLMILKHDGLQKKICTLWVDEKCQRKGIGSQLIERSFTELSTELPLITVSETRFSQFEALFNKYGFEQHQEYSSYYKKHLSEFSFNAGIEDMNSLVSETSVHFMREPLPFQKVVETI